MASPRLAALAALAIFGCSLVREPEPQPVLFPNLGSWHSATSTKSPEAQKWFDQGVTFYWGFNHKEAERSFAKALEIDPSFALAQAYIALAEGPNINSPEMSDDQLWHAEKIADAARDLAWSNPNTRPRDLEIIVAACQRYLFPKEHMWVPGMPSTSTDEEQAFRNKSYADLMKRAYEQFPKDPEIATLYAESMLDLRPWDQWKPDGTPQEGTEELIRALDVALKLAPDHPGANHLYVHALEGSPHPERAIAAADRLRTLVPGIAHLVHMPSHIDVRTGRYALAIEQNEKAVLQDRAYAEVRPRKGLSAMYGAHNAHFIVFAAMFAGNEKEATRGLDLLDEILTPAVVSTLPDVLDGFLTSRDHVLVRFGKWSEILALPGPPASSPVRCAMRHYSRGVALAARGDVDAALVERTKFDRFVETIDPKTMIGNNPASLVMSIGAEQLRGEIDYRNGSYDSAFAHLEEAVRRYDTLKYDEPASWMMPPRHALGALLLEQGRAEAALAVYERDLVQNPENVWSLQGLDEALSKLGRADEAKAAKARFDRAREGSDVEIGASCFCRRGAGG